MLSQATAAAGALCVLAALTVLAGWPWALLALGLLLLASAWAQHTWSAPPPPERGSLPRVDDRRTDG